MDMQAMIEELNGYAEAGDIGGLYRMIARDRTFLGQMEEVEFIRNPVHAAAERGQKAFALEVMGLKPSLGRKLDKKGHSPLHVALDWGEKETVRAMMRFDSSLVRVKGAGGFTPMHHAVVQYPDLDVLADFLYDCPESIDDLTHGFQNAVHLVVGSMNAPAIDLLLKWIVRTRREHVLKRKDGNGNTALHLAARLGCQEAVRLLVKITKLNKRNSANKTPLDEAMDFGHVGIVQILKRAHAKRARDFTPRTQSSRAAYLSSGLSCLETLVRCFSIMVKEMTVEIRNIVLIVAVLITTATYQAILQPPGGFYSGSDDSIAPAASAPAGYSLMSSFSKNGKMVMDKFYYNQFMPANTFAFTMSMVTIVFVMHGTRPYNVILYACLFFLAHSYLTAMFSISKNEGDDDLVVPALMYFLSWSVLLAAFGVKLAYSLVKAVFQDPWWLPRCGVTWHDLAFARKTRRQDNLMNKSR